MKPIYKLLILLTLTLFAAAEEKSASADAVPLTPLIEAMDKGGLVNLDNYLDNNGKWPRISTDSFALKNKITNQKELVVLSNRLIKLLRARADAELPSEIEALDSEAKLFFALGEKFWKADGYRNLVSSLMCIELGSHRCGKIVLVSRGEKMGPNRPEVFKALNPGDMLKLFIAMIPENDAFSKAELSQKLVDTPVSGETWLHILDAIRKIKLEESTAGEKFNEAISIQINTLGGIISNEDLNSLVFHYGLSQVMHESMLPAFAMYLKNGGSLEMLLEEPTNGTKYREVMKDGVYKFSLAPVVSEKVSGDQLANLVESIQGSKKFSERLFGAFE